MNRIERLIAELEKEQAEIQAEIETLSKNRRQAEDAERKAMSRRAQIAKELAALSKTLQEIGANHV